MSPAMNGSFDASQFAPRQGGQAHPVGKYPFTITHTECVPTKDQSGGMFVVHFQSAQGEIQARYNLWNQSAKAVEIAHGQLSALCHAVGIFKLDWSNEGAALRGAKGVMEIGYQKGEEPTAEKPGGGYVEVKKIFDANGNDLPGKAPAVAPQAAQNGGWANAAQAPQTAPQAPSAPAWQPGPSQPQGGPPSWQNSGQASAAPPPWGAGGNGKPPF